MFCLRAFFFIMIRLTDYVCLGMTILSGVFNDLTREFIIYPILVFATPSGFHLFSMFIFFFIMLRKEMLDLHRYVPSYQFLHFTFSHFVCT